MNRGQPLYSGNYSKHHAGGSGDDGRLLVWEVTRAMQEGVLPLSGEISRLMELVHGLSQALDSSRVQYNRALNERDAAHARLQKTANKLTQVENLVKRYAAVQDPVIASDGYTYEKESIVKYLDECTSSNSKAYSQLTKEELTNVVVPNKSLSRLVTLLKEAGPIDVPAMKNLAPISASGGGAGPRPIWTDNVQPGAAVPAPAQPLDANLMLSAAGGVGPTAMTGGIVVPPPASASSGAARGGRYDGGRGGRGVAPGGARPDLHPCLRVYGFCNFMDDCTFANYPYEACLNHIKGKCRFGHNCKELHVDPYDALFQNPRSYANQHNRHAAADNQPSHAQRHPQPQSGNASSTEAGGAAAPASATADGTRTDRGKGLNENSGETTEEAAAVTSAQTPKTHNEAGKVAEAAAEAPAAPSEGTEERAGAEESTAAAE